MAAIVRENAGSACDEHHMRDVIAVTTGSRTPEYSTENQERPTRENNVMCCIASAPFLRARGEPAEHRPGRVDDTAAFDVDVANARRMTASIWQKISRIYHEALT